MSPATVKTLIQSFADTWTLLENYDNNTSPPQGTEQEIQITANELHDALQQLKQHLIQKQEANDYFAREKTAGSLSGIIGNVFQHVFGQDVYPTIEQKAAHLLYFIIKDRPFCEGNKKSGAFAFIWFLQKANFAYQQKISPETLSMLTLLIAASNPADKNKTIGIILLLLNSKH